MAGSISVADMNKAGPSEDKGVLVTESDVPSVKSEERKEDALSQKLDVPSTKSEERKEDVPSQNNPGDQVERMDNDSKPKHVLVIKASKDPTDEALSMQNTLEVHVKVETVDETAVISSQAEVSVESQEKHDDSVNESVKVEVWFLLCLLYSLSFSAHVTLYKHVRSILFSQLVMRFNTLHQSGN